MDLVSWSRDALYDWARSGEARLLCYQGRSRWANGRIPSLRQGALVIGLHAEGFVSCRWIG